MDWMYLFYFLLGVTLFAGSVWFGRGRWNEENISLSQSKTIQGIMALGIALHHMAQKTCAPFHPAAYTVHGLDFFVQIGYPMVAVFLFCSGLGLYRSFRGKPDYLKGFFRRRILPLIIAFYLSEFLHTGIRLLMGQKMDALTVLWYLSGLHMANYYSWYLIVIPFFYLIFWASFRFCRREGAAIAVVFAFSLLYTLAGAMIDHQDDWWMRGEWWYNTILLFPLGLLFGKYSDRILRVFRKGYWFALPFSLAGTILLFQQSEYLNDHSWGFYGEFGRDPLKVQHRLMSAGLQWLVCIFFVAFLLLLTMKVKQGNRILTWLGSRTLEFYLVHGIFVELFGYRFLEVAKPLLYIRSVPLYMVAVLACTVPATMLFHAVWIRLVKLCSGNRHGPDPMSGEKNILREKNLSEESACDTPESAGNEAAPDQEPPVPGSHDPVSGKGVSSGRKAPRPARQSRDHSGIRQAFRLLRRFSLPAVLLLMAVCAFLFFRKPTVRTVGKMTFLPPENYTQRYSDSRYAVWEYEGKDKNPGRLVLDLEIRGDVAQKYATAEEVLQVCDWLQEAELYVNPQGIRMARGYSPGSDGTRERRYYVENENTVFLFCMVEDERYYDIRDCEEVMRQTADALRLPT